MGIFLDNRITAIAEASRMGGDLSNRRSGKTLSGVFKVLSFCLENPEESVLLFDHHNNNRNTLLLNTLPLLKQVLHEMSLEGFYFNKKEISIIFSLDPLFGLKNKELKGL